jgi:hypothetical protein
MAPLSAQELFTVKVGTFRDVKAADFTTLQGKGFLYGTPGADNTMDVFLGHFATQAQVNALATELEASGFRNAQAFALPMATGQQLTVIQIALQGSNRGIDWETMEKAGQLYVESIDGTNKIMTGIYPDARTAASFLPAIRQLGYKDAFVRTVNNLRLIPINSFETGIKKPLIPINMQSAKNETPLGIPSVDPVPSVPFDRPSASPAPAPSPASPGGYGSVETNALPYRSPPTTTDAALPNPATSPTVVLPAIDGKTKRHSSAELQRVLKEKGYYTGAIDGFYGPGTTAAYNKAWDDMSEIRKYRKLSAIAPPPAGGHDLISKWPEVNTLLTVVEDLAAGMGNATRASQLVQQRIELRDASQPLANTAAERVSNWSATLLQNMDEWATEDPLHAQIYSAFRLTYQQSQVRLEDYYMDRGLAPLDARNLATAMLQNMVGAQLDRFL